MRDGVVWLGANGNLYTRVAGQSGVKDLGSAKGTGFLIRNPNMSTWNGLRIVDDPNPPKQQTSAPATTSQVSGGGGDGGAAARAAAAEAAKIKANEANRGATQQAIDSLDQELNIGRSNIDNELKSISGRYDKERTRAAGERDEQSVTNNENLAKNKQNELLAAAQGRRGLRSTLGSLGALGGDGGKLADRAVQTAANRGLGEASDTATTNAKKIGKAWDDFEDKDKERRAEAQTTAENNRRALEGKIATKRQGYYRDMANLWGDIGRGDDAAHWARAAGDLNPTIASNTSVSATPIQARSAAFTPGDLESYLAGAGDMSVSVQSGGLGNNSTPTLTAGRRKKEEKESKFAAA